MKIRLADHIQYDSIVDGEGLRTVIWTQGCPHHCAGCHNPTTHNSNGGKLTDVERIEKALLKIPRQDGITLSGGEPFMQLDACTELATFAKSIGLNVWCYTGYRYEELLELAKQDSRYLKMLSNIDVLIDGKFMIEQRSFNTLFRGSKNQRIIDVPRSLSNNNICTVSKYDGEVMEQDLYEKQEFMFV
jgi:anaerobic ribonucleoside-triphosphate reductase activating protein